MRVLLILIILLSFFGFYTLEASASVVLKPQIGEDLFACNAGIMHPNQGVNGFDSINVQYEDMNVAADHPAHFRANTLESDPSANNYQILFDDNSIWYKKVTQLNFNFSTEKTGASYFVDFCYLGPLEDIKANGSQKKDLSEGIYTLNSSLTSTDLIQAGLQAKVEYICDLRQFGNAKNARTINEVAPMGDFETDSFSYGDFSTLSSNGIAMEQIFNSKTIQAPRFCRLRASFTESKIADRKKGSENTEMTVFLDIQKN